MNAFSKADRRLFSRLISLFLRLMETKQYLYDDAFWHWIEEHIYDDVFRLRLSVHGDTMLEDACTQIECRRKTAKKLPQTLSAARFYFPNTLSAEQATSDRLADFHATLVDDGSRVLDMTAGLGIDAMHLSDRATDIDACDINPELTAALEFNTLQAGITNIRACNYDSVKYIRGCEADKYDVVFIDPARRAMSGSRLYALSDCVPDVVASLPEIMRISPRLIVKASPMLDISRVHDELPGAFRLIAAGTATECKEVIAVCGRTAAVNPVITAFTTDHGQFCFTRVEESEATPDYKSPATGALLYEPYPAVMKAAPFRLLCERFEVKKVSVSTHLYISPAVIDEFPGKCYRIIDVFAFDKRGIKAIASAYPMLNIAVRNFPLSAEKLQAKLKIKTGGDLKMFGVTDYEGHRLMVVTQHEG